VGIEAPKIHVGCMCTGPCIREQYHHKYAIAVSALGGEVVVRMLSKGNLPSAHIKVACSEVHTMKDTYAQVAESKEYKRMLEMEVGPQPTRPRTAAMPTAVVKFQHIEYDVERWRAGWLQLATKAWTPAALALFDPGDDGIDQTCVAWTPTWLSGPHTECDVHVGPDAFCARCKDPMLEQHISFLFHNPLYGKRDGICVRCARLDVPCVVCGGASSTRRLTEPREALKAAMDTYTIHCTSCFKPVCPTCMAVHFPYWTKYEVIPRSGEGFQCGGCDWGPMVHLI